MILTSGAFDGVHAGHVAYLEAAKALCKRDELLVCAVAPDDYIIAAKGRPPYWHQADRVRTVHALGCVDAAIPQQQNSVASLIRDYRPRLFVKGPDWEGRLPEAIHDACREVGTAIGYVASPGTHVSEARLTDEDALAQFETLVAGQQRPAPWRPVTDYSFEARKEIEGQHPQLIKDVFQPTAVMDYGCGPGHLIALLRAIGVDAYGYEPSSENIALEHATASPYISRSLIASLRWGMGDRRLFDLVICREVLEHCTIRQIRQIVSRVCGMSSRYVYVTTRFAAHPQHFLHVDTSDDLDPTHCSLLTPQFLRTLFVLEGLRRRADLEQKLDWKRLGRVLVYERS